MSDPMDDGGHAFPTLHVFEEWDRDAERYRVASDIEVGMSLRDYFAAKALQGRISEGTFAQILRYTPDIEQPEVVRRFAENCYRVADAMLEARKR